jgi:hypothetical protein
MIRSLVGPVVAAGLLAACASPPAGSPALPQPSLVSVALRGSQICGPFNTQVDGTFAFVCMPLPTTIASGWELNPDWTTNAQDKLRANQTAIVTLTTTSLAEIDVTYRPSPTAAWVMRQVPPGQYAVPPTISNRAVEASAVDDGTTKTWTIRVRTELCRDVTPLEFRALGTGRPPSTPLLVTLLRAPSPDRCAFSGGGPFLGSSTSGSSPPSSSTPAACPGGAAKQQVILCLQCPKDAPKGLWEPESDEVCSAAGYLARRKNEKPTCDVWQVPTVEACVFP